MSLNYYKVKKMFILGITESNWVDIGLVCFHIFLGLFLTYKAKADKAEILIDVDNKIDKKVNPVENRMDNHDKDFKEFKRDEIEPMKTEIHELITKQTVIDVKIDGISEGITDIKKLIGKVFDELNNKKDK